MADSRTPDTLLEVFAEISYALEELAISSRPEAFHAVAILRMLDDAGYDVSIPESEHVRTRPDPRSPAERKAKLLEAIDQIEVYKRDILEDS